MPSQLKVCVRVGWCVNFTIVYMSEVNPQTLKTIFLVSFLVLFKAVSSHTHTDAHSLVPGSSAGWSLPLENLFTVTHQPLTRIAFSFKSHASFCYCSIQTDSRTLRYFPLYVLWISLHDTIEGPSLWYQKLSVHLLLVMQGLWKEVWMKTWKHRQD